MNLFNKTYMPVSAFVPQILTYIFTRYKKCNKLIVYQVTYIFIYLLFYITFNSQSHIAMGSLQVEETSAYCTVNHQASASNYQLSNMKRQARDSNQPLQRLARTLTATPPSPLSAKQLYLIYCRFFCTWVCFDMLMMC